MLATRCAPAPEGLVVTRETVTHEARDREARTLLCPVCGRCAYPAGDRVPQRGRLRVYCRPSCRDRARRERRP